MAGQIKTLIDLIIEKRSRGNPVVIGTTRAKLILKGLNPDFYTANSSDDPDVIAKVKRIAKELGVAI